MFSKTLRDLLGIADNSKNCNDKSDSLNEMKIYIL